MIYLGEWGGVSVYQPEYEYRESVGVPSRKTIWRSCRVRWLWPSVAEHQDGMCHQCWKTEFEGKPDIPL